MGVSVYAIARATPVVIRVGAVRYGMSDSSDRASWVSENAASAALVAACAVLVALIILPFVNYVLLAVVFAYVLWPVRRVLAPWIGSRIAAAALVVVAMVAVVLPLAYVLAVALQEGAELAAMVREGDLTEAAIEERLAATGYPQDLGGLYATYRDPVRTWLQGVTSSALEIAGGVVELLVGLTISAFVLYALLNDGDSLLAWVRRVAPIDDGVQEEVLTELDRLMWASVVGNVGIALVQALLLAMGAWLLGIPGIVLVAVVTFVAALLPVVGVVVVWLPLVGYLLVVGRPVAAALLFAYGMALSGIDNYLRAVVIGYGSELDVATVVVGIFGGVALFGVVGLFVGPVVLGGSKVVVETVAREATS